MSDALGTIEYIAGEFARLLQPLAQRAENNSGSSLLEWLGLHTPDVPGASNLATAVAAIVSTGEGMPGLLADFAKAVEAGDAAAGVEAGAALLERFLGLIKAAHDTADALHTLSSSPGLNATQQTELSNFAGEFADRLLNRLFVEYIEARFPYLAIALMATGGIEVTNQPGGAAGSLSAAYTQKTFHFDRTAKLLTAPADLFNDIYHWGRSDFDGIALFTALQ